MLEETQKVSKSYSLDPAVIAWVMQKAARLTIEGNGERASDSKVVNDILAAAMNADKRESEYQHKLLNTTRKIKAVAK